MVLPQQVLTLALDKVDDLDRGLGDVRHVLPVRELAEEGRGTNDDIDAVNAYRARSSVCLFIVARAA